MAERTNCPNCCAVVDPDADRCAYCGTPYPWAHNAAATMDPVPLYIDAQKLAAAVAGGIITPNEARRRLGLRGRI